MSCWVVNTGALIFLAKLNHLNLLEKQADQILLPPAVLTEVKVYQDSAMQQIEAACQTWLNVQTVKQKHRTNHL